MRVERRDLALGIGGVVGHVGLGRRRSSGAPLAFSRPMISSCSRSGVRSQRSTKLRMIRTAW